ncbi:type II toxin-antitoxin system MqsA family antitoxin [Providencia rettgeri]|uniref:type II toxin-antitoxin system MqsA family antitoxin n=1 Tax=Providencia TaxID=586 RepID=UPI0024AADB4A|nr:type II toxin-antitoxin system MqsA family antitoxin [Providencia rettgeri]
MKKEICPVCGMGHLSSTVESVEFEYKTIKKALNTKYSICDECGSEIATADDAKFNKRSVTAFHKQVDGLLTGKELKEIRKELGITQQQASAIFGGGPNSFTKYEHDDVIQSVAMDKFIRTAYKHEVVFLDLCEQAGISTSKMHLNKIIKASIQKEVPSQYIEFSHYSHGKSAKQLVC